MLLKSLSRYRDLGLLLLRIGIGLVYVFVHGWSKVFNADIERWESLGSGMATLGIEFFPAFWGLMAAITELAGGILLMLGFLFRPTVFLLFFTMLIATLVQIGDTGGIGTAASHPLKMAILFVALFLIGPGKYSIDGR